MRSWTSWLDFRVALSLSEAMEAQIIGFIADTSKLRGKK